MNINKILGIVVSLLVVVVIGVGFYISGPPAKQRMSNFDSTRVQNIKRISYGITSYAVDNKRLPNSIASIVDGKRLDQLPLDPVRSTEYIYKTTSDESYDLCAEFSRSSIGAAKGDFWYHPAGEHCFNFTVTYKE